jgi:threonine aldolase
LAKELNIKLHLDGARLWNASVATGIPIAEYCLYFDSVSLCFSKGLGAPVGSVLVGSLPVIKKARHFRKLYGGKILSLNYQVAGVKPEYLLVHAYILLIISCQIYTKTMYWPRNLVRS